MKACLYCGRPFVPHRGRDGSFCSVACANKSRRKHFEKPCKQCGALFQPPRSRTKQQFCSLRCRDAARRTAKTVVCAQCGAAVVRKAYRVATLAHSFCSLVCSRAWRRSNSPRGSAHPQYVPPARVTCDTCGAPLERWPSRVKAHNFCGVTCRETWQRTSGYSSGPKNAVWRGGYEDYRGPNWNRQRRRALERDRHRCTVCGTTKSLQVHHVQPWVTFSHYLEANQLDNLQTLCLRCHKLVEWDYWRTHPEIVHLYPDTRRIHTCRRCGAQYVTKSARSLDCDTCSPKRSRALRVGGTPAPAVLPSGHPVAEAS